MTPSPDFHFYLQYFNGQPTFIDFLNDSFVRRLTFDKNCYYKLILTDDILAGEYDDHQLSSTAANELNEIRARLEK